MCKLENVQMCKFFNATVLVLSLSFNFANLHIGTFAH